MRDFSIVFIIITLFLMSNGYTRAHRELVDKMDELVMKSSRNK